MPGAFLHAEHIKAFSLLSFSDCRVTDPRKAKRAFGDAAPQSVCVFLIPYYVPKRGRLSRFCAPRDYHLYFEELCGRAKVALPGFLCGFCDNSPIDERALACRGGLGALGKNGLIIHETYGSFCLIGTFFFSLALPEKTHTPPSLLCEGCDACRAACPTGCLRDAKRPCLSALSQQKHLSEQQARLLEKNGVLWGCDACQECCLHNQNLTETPLSFFRERLICDLDEAALDAMLASGEFSLRAYAWRGEAVLRRNIKLSSPEG